MKLDWKRKLTSRKLWTALVGFVSALMLGFGASESDAAEVAAIITAGATLIAYIIGEGLVDAAAVEVDAIDTTAADAAVDTSGTA